MLRNMLSHITPHISIHTRPYPKTYQVGKTDVKIIVVQPEITVTKTTHRIITEATTVAEEEETTTTAATWAWDTIPIETSPRPSAACRTAALAAIRWQTLVAIRWARCRNLAISIAEA